MQHNVPSSVLLFLMFFKTFSCASIAQDNIGPTGFETNPDAEFEEIFGEDIDLDIDEDPATTETNVEEAGYETNPEEAAGLFEGDIDLGDGGIFDLYSVNPKKKKWPHKTLIYHITPGVFSKWERKEIRKGGHQN